MTDHITRIGLGGGCHWCTEGVFQSVRGVISVEQGHMRSFPPADAWAEAILLAYDSRELDLPTLVDVHVHSHDATIERSAGSKYRSAIYVMGSEQREAAQKALVHLGQRDGLPVATRVLDLAAFRPSDERLKNFYQRYPDRGFSKRYIAPALDRLRNGFPELISKTGADRLEEQDRSTLS